MTVTNMVMRELRERGILFSGEMVRAIIYDRKSKTRRTRGLDRVNEHPDGFTFDRWQDGYRDGRRRAVFLYEGEPVGVVCPYGQPGDRLWVRETWASLVFERDWESGYIDGWHEAPTPRAGKIVYDADEHGFNDNGDSVEERGFAWKPSIHMPRWASRLTLEITDVRVERVQDISEADALDEGLSDEHFARVSGTMVTSADSETRDDWITESCTDAFARLWNSINAKRGYGWDANPWVWVIAFRRVES